MSRIRSGGWMVCESPKRHEMKKPVVVIILLKAFICAAYDVVRNTGHGPVGGRKIEILGTTVEEFRGIPYAEPPVGELRFKPPVPARTRQTTLNATNRRSGCPQPMDVLPSSGFVEYGEDCLHLNIWVHEESSQAPVLVWIHGGGFTYGSASADNYTGAVIAAKTGIVVVSMNYRLGLLGFLNANSSESPGNMGHLDQSLALKWIVINIHNFGGDPSSITIFGESAGGMSVHAHMLSPKSRGLFRRAIAMSGVINAYDFTHSAEESMVRGDAVAGVVGCLADQKTLATHPDEVIGCLRTRSADELLQAASRAVPGKLFPFLPTYEDDFLPEKPSVALRAGSFDPKVDFLTGVTSDEGVTLFLWNQTNPQILAGPLDNVDRETLINAGNKAVLLWTQGASPSLAEIGVTESTGVDSIRRKFVDYLGTKWFVCPMHSAAAAHASRGGKVYTYVFDHWPAKRAPLSWAGVGHGMDLPYIFGLPLLDRDQINFNEQDVAMSEKLITLISSFAGLPVFRGVTSWPEYHISSPLSMLLKNDNATNINGFFSEHCATSSTHS
uniref:Carboxylic ester hydrolase n=1 Tax=Amblyomma maculatum TaxID=34609 RepID=G3MSH9_AMBMU